MFSEQFYFEGDGTIPNSKYPVVVYRQVIDSPSADASQWLVERFAKNGWTNSWKDGVFPYPHYHSNTHEVLGVCKGMANLKFGGEEGKLLYVTIGDVIVIPAGVAHQGISNTPDFEVIGAYPNGQTPDLIRAEQSKYHTSLAQIAQISIPVFDPIFGEQGIALAWK